MQSVLCVPATSMHGACTRVWFMNPVSLHWRTLIFCPLRQLSNADLFLITAGSGCQFYLLHTGILYSLNLCSACVYCHTLCKFIHASFLWHLERSVFLKSFTTSALRICLLLIVYRYPDREEKGFILASQDFQVSHTLHIISCKFLLILIYCPISDEN